MFKAKRLDNGEWVEGFYQVRKDVFENDEQLIFRGESYHTWEYAKIDPTTLCQYTGLTDKNGNKIWENDICRNHGANSDICVIRFGDYCNNNGAWHIGFFTEWSRCRDTYRQDLGFWVHARELEVIGNIFDNSELLGGKGDGKTD